MWGFEIGREKPGSEDEGVKQKYMGRQIGWKSEKGKVMGLMCL